MLAALLQDAPPPLTPERLRAANIHPETKLATDYLNHFNEAIMLLDLVPAMPECLEDVAAWTPLSYEEHFSRSSYRDKELVLEAYAQAPILVRRRFLALVRELDEAMMETIEALTRTGPTAIGGYVAEEAADRLKHLAARVAGVMNGVADEEADIFEPPSAQEAIDALMTR